MTRVYLETEHQELLHPASDLRGVIRTHIPSALGKLGYFVFLRVPAAMADKLGHVVTRLKVAGLYPDDEMLRFGEGLAGPTQFPSKVAGLTWVALCRARVSRGDGELTFLYLPAGLDRADVLICTWPRFVESGQADDQFAGLSDPQFALTGLALGGIGCGKVEFCRDGRFRNFSGNNNQDMPFEDPDGLAGACFSVEVDKCPESEDFGGGVERVLSTRPIVTRGGLTLEAVPELSVSMAFPQAVVTAKNVAPNVDVRVTLSGTVVPHDLKRSSLPGFLARWSVRNGSKKAVRVRLRLAWPNLVGFGGGIGTPETRIGYADGSYRYWTAPEKQRVELVSAPGCRALKYSNDPSDVCPAADGHHYLVVRDLVGQEGKPASSLFGETAGDATIGWAGAELPIAPGQTATLDMAVVWEMPHWVDSLNIDRGQFWQNYANNGTELLAAFMENFDSILADAAALARLLDDTDLPEWLRRRLSNCCYPLVTNSVLYKDGRFSINEGPTEMTGCYGTMDQRLGAHPATFLLFPELNRAEMTQFTRVQNADGAINHDLGTGHLESGPKLTPWPDVPCSFIIQWAMHCWSLGDDALDAAVYDNARRALHRVGLWADQGKGVPQISARDEGGHALGTSYDGYHYIGTMAYVATLWLAALQVMRKWAAKYDDRDLLAKIDVWMKAAHERLETDLWNGNFYRAYASVTGPANENSHAGMLGGEYYARLLAGEDVLPDARIDPCCDALLSLNGNAKFRVPPDEVSADLTTFTEYGWLPYVESFCLAPLAIRGRQAMWDVWRNVIESMEMDNASPCETRLMYQPVSGAKSWGSYYMTAPASWLVYQAAADYAYWPAEGTLRVSPSMEGKFAIVHPLFWALGEKKGSRVSVTVRNVWTRQKLAVTALELPATAATVNGAKLAPAGKHGVYRRFTLPSPVVLTEGEKIEWTVA